MDIGPRPGINIYQNQVRTFAILGATAAQRRRPIASNIGQKCLTSDPWKRRSGVRFAYRGMTSTFDLGGVSGERLAESALGPSFIAILLAFVRNFRTS